MAIKYEIHYLPNAGGNEETRRFAHIFEQTAMTDKEMISRIARHSCLGEGEVSSVLMKLRDIIEEDLQDGRRVNIPEIGYLSLSVNLGFSMPHKDAILCLRSGMPLTYHDHCLCLPSTGRDIAQLSIKMKEKLGKWELKGYKVTAARIRFIVAWKSKDAPRDEKESAIVLADLVMKRIR
jgi:hypothetical protein